MADDVRADHGDDGVATRERGEHKGAAAERRPIPPRGRSLCIKTVRAATSYRANDGQGIALSRRTTGRRGRAALTPRVDLTERLERAASPLTRASLLLPVSATFAQSLDVCAQGDDGHGLLTMTLWTPPAPSPTQRGSAWIVARHRLAQEDRACPCPLRRSQQHSPCSTATPTKPPSSRALWPCVRTPIGKMLLANPALRISGASNCVWSRLPPTR